MVLRKAQSLLLNPAESLLTAHSHIATQLQDEKKADTSRCRYGNTYSVSHYEVFIGEALRKLFFFLRIIPSAQMLVSNFT